MVAPDARASCCALVTEHGDALRGDLRVEEGQVLRPSPVAEQAPAVAEGGSGGRKQEQDLLVMSSGQLIGTLREHDLVDVYRSWRATNFGIPFMRSAYPSWSVMLGQAAAKCS